MSKLLLGGAIALLVWAGPIVSRAEACTSFLVTRAASQDGSTMVTYAADSHSLYGALSYRSSGRYAEGELVDVHDWDTGKFLGKIKQVKETYSVVGNMNEHQLAIAESTFGGRDELVDKKGIVDYGSLIYITLQRARTAREAVQTMGDLVNTYGYASTGESFSISDPNEVWLMEMIGMGPGRTGAVWVALRVPNGFVSAHANQARIRKFPLRDPQSCLYSKNVISFAREKKYFSGKDEDFSFADAYAPLTYGALRGCEGRVWAMFRRVAPSLRLGSDYVKGVPGAPPLPLWVKPDKKLSTHDVMGLMRDHFEGTDFDLSKGVGAGPYNLPYRWRPLTWKVGNETYRNDRATSTQQTAFSFVSQSRAWLPNPIGGVLWFGVDDTYTTVYMPMYCGITKVPRSLNEQTANFNKFSWDSAFWTFNFVANYAYSRYRDMIQDIQTAQRQLEGSFLADQRQTDSVAVNLYKTGPALAREYLTSYAATRTEQTMDRWKDLGQELIVKYLDGNVRDERGKVTHPGYPQCWYRSIARESGEHYREKPLPDEKERPPHAGSASPPARYPADESCPLPSTPPH